jgi:hypothetical protein
MTLSLAQTKAICRFRNYTKHFASSAPRAFLISHFDFSLAESEIVGSEKKDFMEFHPRGGEEGDESRAF